MRRLSICLVVFLVGWFSSVLSLGLSGLIAALLYLLTGGWKWLHLLSRTLKRDLLFLKTGAIMLFKTKRAIKSNMLLSDAFFETVKRHPDKPAYISADTGKTLSYEETEKLVIKIANFFYAAGYKKGDVVALLMENRIEYVPIWLALSMIGVVTALINYNLRNDGLKHCISISNCKSIIFSEDMSVSIAEIAGDLKQDLFCFDQFDCNIANVKYLKTILETVPLLKPPRSPEITVRDPILYVYTSGTTGLPKASVVRGEKILSVLYLGSAGLQVQASDTFYNALPLYHANGMITGSHPIVNGCTIVVKKKFSASKFMEECCKYKATCINYIGEVCRYLLAQPKRTYDRAHSLRLASGNGLKASIWREFQERFGIEKIVEVYGATEGNIGLANLTGHVGAVGHNLIAFPFLNMSKIIKVDKDTGEIMRGSDGLAILAKPGEHGQIVGIIKKQSFLTYDGYLDKTATRKKIAHDIFTKGDSVFLSGDIIIMDEEGYFYFQDRTGDTFRWRGENVSTNEVEGVISKAANLVDVTVFGVEIPGVEGRAGMACFHDPDKKIDVAELQTSLHRDLPKYAHPIFLRMTSQIDVTGTFKLQKVKLREEGYNIYTCPDDDYYYFDSVERRYLRLDAEKYQQVLNGGLRF